MNLKLAAIDTVTELEGSDLLSEGLALFAVLSLDGAADVRAAMKKKFFPRFLGDNSDPSLADSLRAKLVQVVLSRLINCESMHEKMAALQVAGLVGCCDGTLTDVLLTLLEADSQDIRISVLTALDSLHCTRPDAVAASVRFLHSSSDALRDAASVFAFNACVAGNVAVGVAPEAFPVVDAAVWHLSQESRTGREVCPLCCLPL